VTIKRSGALALGALIAGCASNGAPRQAPSGVRPAALAITIGDFQDTDLNRYRDRTTAVIYIWGDSSNYPIPIKAKGSFEFRLQRHDGPVLATWNFDQAQTAAAERSLAPGPGYVFDLNLASVGAEKIPDREAEILCTFTPAEGEPLRNHPSAPLLVGPVSSTERAR
jgi:hypothetical protein